MTDTDDSCAAELSFIARFTASCARRPMLWLITYFRRKIW
jgi:hypothetical protein